jgi:osmotically-inducible protein OsmY
MNQGQHGNSPEIPQDSGQQEPQQPAGDRRHDLGSSEEEDRRVADQQLEDAIVKVLRGASHIDSHDVRVHVEDGCVTIGGTVPEERMRPEIRSVAHALPGVRKVIDDDLLVHD